MNYSNAKTIKLSKLKFDGDFKWHYIMNKLKKFAISEFLSQTICSITYKLQLKHSK